jgi:hypothetical protein
LLDIPAVRVLGVEIGGGLSFVFFIVALALVTRVDAHLTKLAYQTLGPIRLGELLKALTSAAIGAKPSHP